MALPTGGVVVLAVVGLLGLSAIAAGATVSVTGPTPPSQGGPAVAAGSGPATTPSSRPVIGVEGAMTVGKFPTFMAEDLANGWMYVANEGSATVTILDGTHIVANVSAGGGASGLVYDPESQFVYVADTTSDQVTVIDGTTNIATLPAGDGPCAPAYDAEDGWVYVPNSGSSTVTILNGTSVITTAPVGSDPVDATYDAANGTVYITNQQDNFENILYGNATVALAPTYLIQPFATVYDPVNGFLYITNITPNDGILSDVTVLNGTNRVATFGVGPGPSYPAVNTSSGDVFLPSIGLDSVQILNGTSITGDVLVGGDPTSAQFDPENGLVYVTDDLTNDVTVLNSTRVLADVVVGANPTIAAFDSKNGYVYVTARGAGETFALGPVTGWAVNFTESGLPTGEYWSVTVKEVTVTSDSDYALEYQANGTYAYEIGVVLGYDTHPATGAFNVTGNPVDIVISFTMPSKPAGPGFLGLPNPIGAVLVGSSVAIVVGVTAWQVIAWRRRRKERILRA